MKCTDQIVSKMDEQKLLKYDRDVYIYGLNNGLMLFINLITSLVIALIVHQFWALVIFLVCFMPLRSYCGGIHSHSRIVCYIISNLIILAVLLSYQYLYSFFIYIGAFSFCCFIYLCITKPINNKKRNLDSSEIKFFQKIKLAILVLELFIFGLLFLIIPKYSIIVLLAIVLVFFLVIIEKLYLYIVK